MSVEAEIAAAEQALYRAMIAEDFAALDALLADDVIYIHSTAVAESKAEYFAGVQAGLYEYEAIDSRDVSLRCCDDVVLQTGTLRMVVGARDQPKAPIDLLFTLAWKREPSGWRLWQRHATRMG